MRRHSFPLHLSTSSSTPNLTRSHSLFPISTPSSPCIHDRIVTPPRVRPRPRPRPSLPFRNMSSSSHSVPLSPMLLESWNVHLSRTDGRDKLFRLIQYLCKLLRGLDMTSQPTLSSRLVHLETVLSSGRQTFRLLKWASVFSRLRTRGLGGIADCALFCYYLLDNLAFLSKSGLVPLNPKQTTRRAARFWLVATLAALAAGVVELVKVRKLLQRERKKKEEDGQDTGGDEDMNIAWKRGKEALIKCCKHASDAVVAASLASEKGLHPRTVGACGVVSSCVGFWQTWPRYMPTE